MQKAEFLTVLDVINMNVTGESITFEERSKITCFNISTKPKLI